MTRINLVPPQELSDSHLGAEYRELPRIFGLVAAAHARGERPDDRRNPRRYTLGPGHVRFFYNKLQFLADRQRALVAECLRRGRKVSFAELPIGAHMIPADWWGSFEPSPEDLALNRSRIADRTPAPRIQGLFAKELKGAQLRAALLMFEGRA